MTALRECPQCAGRRRSGLVISTTRWLRRSVLVRLSCGCTLSMPITDLDLKPAYPKRRTR